MRKQPIRPALRRTPKVFQSTTSPIRRTFEWSRYRSLLPLFWFAGLLLALYLVRFLPVFRITKVEVVGQTTEEITQELNNFVGQTIFVSGLETRVKRIESDHWEVEQLTCQRGLPHILRCQETLRAPALIWQETTGKYVVDKNGFLYARHSGETGLLIVDRLSQSPIFGQKVVSSEFINDYQKVAALLGQNKLEFSEFAINETLYQLEINLTGSQNPDIPFAAKTPIKVLLVVNSPIEGQIKTLVEVLKTQHDKITDHLDLRVPGYAYFK